MSRLCFLWDYQIVQQGFLSSNPTESTESPLPGADGYASIHGFREPSAGTNSKTKYPKDFEFPEISRIPELDATVQLVK